MTTYVRPINTSISILKIDGSVHSYHSRYGDLIEGYIINLLKEKNKTFIFIPVKDSDLLLPRMRSYPNMDKNPFAIFKNFKEYSDDRKNFCFLKKEDLKNINQSNEKKSFFQKWFGKKEEKMFKEDKQNFETIIVDGKKLCKFFDIKKLEEKRRMHNFNYIYVERLERWYVLNPKTNKLKPLHLAIRERYDELDLATKEAFDDCEKELEIEEFQKKLNKELNKKRGENKQKPNKI